MVLLFAVGLGVTAQAQAVVDDDYVRQQIAVQQQRFNSSDPEERREAVLHLGWIKRAEASRVVAPALHDPDQKVRAAACVAVLSLPADEAAGLLLPVLEDKSPFVRQEAAFALGQTRSRAATAMLINELQADRFLYVRAAAAVALGQIGDNSADAALASVLSGSIGGKPRDKSKTEIEFLRRAAAVALGQIGDRGGVPALVAALTDVDDAHDVRRESARALGLIGDPAAAPALQAALTDRDPYLSQLAQDALDRMRRASQ